MISEEQFGQIQTAFKKFAPAARQSMQRYRVRLVSALTPAHRVAISQAIGEYAVADYQSDDVLTKRIEAILSEKERRNVVNALSTYVDEQQEIGARAFSALISEHPDFLKNAHPTAHKTASASPKSSDAATILAHWLPTFGITGGTTSATSPLLSAFSFSGPNDTQLRAQMRSSMLGALSQEDRTNVGRAIGSAALSTTSSDGTLSKELEKLLSPTEQDQIVGAFERFFSAQVRAQAEFPRPRGPVGIAFTGPNLETVARSGKQPEPGAVLWRALLLKGATVGFVAQ